MKILNANTEFPHPETANEDGIVAIGGDLSVGRLLKAYRSGIFPWFEEACPILWWSPDPRMVLFPKEIKVSKNMKKLITGKEFEVTFNKNFEEVIRNCAIIKRKGQSGTWITNEMIDAYCKLFKRGYARSVEVWKNKELVGGLYGVDLGDVFSGESMFSKVNNASKIGFITLADTLHKEGYKIIDCQVYTAHLESMGAVEIPRKEYLKFLKMT